MLGWRRTDKVTPNDPTFVVSSNPCQSAHVCMYVCIRGSTLNIGSYHGGTQKDSDSQSCHSTLHVVFSSFWTRNLDAAAETETSLALV